MRITNKLKDNYKYIMNNNYSFQKQNSISDNEVISIHEWDKTFFSFFNEAYQSYLNNISPVIFLNTFLEKLVNLTGSRSGFIASITNLSETQYLCIDTACNKIMGLNEIDIPTNIILDKNTESIFSYSIHNKTIYINNQLQGSELKYYKSKSCNVKSIITIPYEFNHEIRGIIGLTDRTEYTDEMIPRFKTLGNLFGTLHVAYSTIKKSSIETDNRFITYQLMEEILHSTTDGIIVTDSNYKILFINQRSHEDIQQIHGSSNLDIIGSPITNIFDQMSFMYDSASKKLFRNRKMVIYTKKRIYGDMLHSSLSDASVEMVFETTINSVIHNNTIYHVFLLRDVSEKVNLDENIQKKQNNFIAFLSHELRNPLQSIILSNYLLQKELKKCDLSFISQIKNYMGIMERSCNDMRKIISDILDLSKIEAKELSIDIDICNIKNLLEELVSMHAKEIKINCTFGDELPEILYTDEVRLSQVLTNLLTNAIKYTGDDVTKKIILINTVYNQQTNYIEFNVTDNGIGIREDELNQLFKEFGKTSNNFKVNCNSNGLGLCISQKMAHLLGGYISVKSELNKGSTFTLHHPLTLQNKNLNSKSNLSEQHIKGKILLVDDNGSNLSLLKMLMEHFNCELNYDLEIHAVNSGYDAIKICQINNYDIIFMDINMVGMDGCTACKMIRQDGYNKIIIATTGNILAKQNISGTQTQSHVQTNCDTIQTKYSCFDDIIIKPYDNIVILKAIQKFLKN